MRSAKERSKGHWLHLLPLNLYVHCYWMGWVQPVAACIPLHFSGCFPVVLDRGEDRGFLREVSPWGLWHHQCTEGWARRLLQRGAFKVCNCKNPKAKQWKNWLDKCGKLLEINSPQRHSQPFWSWFKVMGYWILLRVGWAWGEGWCSLWGVQGAQRVPSPSLLGPEHGEEKPAGSVGGQKPPFPGAGAKLRALSKMRGWVWCPPMVAGEGRARQGCGSCCRPASILPCNTFKVLTCLMTPCKWNEIVAPGSS